MAALHAIWSSPTGRTGLLIVVGLTVCALLAPALAPRPPSQIDIAARFAGPSAAHWLGTDHLGRDLLSRTLYGARIALGVSVAITLLALLAGALLGIGAAYAPRWLERTIIVVFDLVNA